MKLNLGCGATYKPGYINIDKFDGSVADLVSDVKELPFKSNSVEAIEASHLIEHFGYVHSKYVLSEWFRILKPKGTLVLETPDLDKSLKKFRLVEPETQKTMLQWIYGIDSKGMQHKIGFTFRLLKNLLEEIGFEEISKERARTHRYEPGMRIVCRKPKEYLNKQFFACFRKNLMNRLAIDDSYELIDLEEHCVKEIFWIYSEKFKKNKNGCIDEIIIKTSICNPTISSIFCDECIKFGFVRRGEIKNKIDLINSLMELEFHKKVFSLWAKSRKTVAETDKFFGDFMERLEFLIKSLLDEKSGHEKRLSYISALKPANIKFFTLLAIQTEAKKLFNKGVREFCKNNFSAALNLFLGSTKLNPKNPLVHWNIARLKAVLKYDEGSVMESYKNVLALVQNKGNLKIEEESKCVLGKKMILIPKEPIPENYGA